MILKHQEEPLYLQIYHHLRSEIQKGTRSEGEKLNSERALAKEFGVSRETARKAYACLKKDKLIKVTPKRGSYVGKT